MDTRLQTNTHYHGNPVQDHYDQTMVGDNGDHTLIFFKWKTPDAKKLPYEMDIDEAISFVKGWLNRADIGDEPDHDGCNERGWRVFTEQWGHVAGISSAMYAIQPKWTMYGK